MSSAFKTAVLVTVAAILCAATFILVPHLRNVMAVSDGYESSDEENGLDETDETEAKASSAAESPNTGSSRAKQTARNRSSDLFGDHEETKFEVAEMRNEVEEMVRKFRGTPEDRQEVIEECEGGKELIRLFADLSESSIENMSPEELEKERESFEKEYRAQLDYIQTGQLQRMLKTPEEEEVIGSTIEAVQEFLERIDGALHSAGY